MSGIKKLARDTAVLTGASLLMRCVGLAYQVWLAGQIGAAGIGLWQLVTSVSMLSATLAISGIRFTTTRLVAEEYGHGRGDGVDAAVNRCLLYAAAFGSAAFLALYFCAERIGFLWIGDARTVMSLRWIAFTMPMISVSCVLNGYFIASGAAWKTAAVQVAEQLVNVAAVMVFLRLVPGDDLELSCAAIARGNLAADAVSLLLIGAAYFSDRRRRTAGSPGPRLAGRMLRIALPLAFSAYARSGLSTLQHLLVPRKLRAAGFSADSALSGCGTITGIVFPVITFPACLLTALAELLIPELTAAQVQGNTGRIRRGVRKLLRLTLLYSAAVASGLLLFATQLGRLLYHSESVGRYIRIFALLVPIMYMDIVTDGCLKGLGEMMRSMCYNIAEACVGVLLVISLLPRKALAGYIFVIYFCELFNFTLSITRLRKTAGLSKRSSPEQ